MDKEQLIFLGAASVTGALTSLGLSFTALSPLVIGGIVAAIPVILLAACAIPGGECSKKDVYFPAVLCVASVAIGVGLAATATAIFPGDFAWTMLCSFSRCNNSADCRVTCNHGYNICC